MGSINGATHFNPLFAWCSLPFAAIPWCSLCSSLWLKTIWKCCCALQHWAPSASLSHSPSCLISMPLRDVPIHKKPAVGWTKVLEGTKPSPRSAFTTATRRNNGGNPTWALWFSRAGEQNSATLCHLLKRWRDAGVDAHTHTHTHDNILWKKDSRAPKHNSN